MRYWLAIVLLTFSAIALADTSPLPDMTRYPDGTRIYPDSAIYQGMNIRLDIANPIFELARSGGRTWEVEVLLNTRLKYRYYPTLEAGYAAGYPQIAGGQMIGQGAFVRAGLDINPLKKHPERMSYMTVGVRVGTALQQMTASAVPTITNSITAADVWGEIVAGVNVQIYAGFTMGWAVRMKWLFTTNSHGSNPAPYYIPGYGYTGSMRWGAEYYIGYKF